MTHLSWGEKAARLRSREWRGTLTHARCAGARARLPVGTRDAGAQRSDTRTRWYGIDATLVNLQACMNTAYRSSISELSL